ncbi:DNA-binding transcriptional MerR regulator [Kribbella sp. VKM Ac-2569]|uniref:MerR family transcriptional regulator n=1 Tax=Kribbella sp. VKM Ac-2569 TaxID=2512220 RepID=UPI0010D6469D|nr:MerR family transcriptional regulator [Kribbella sp. VKM Ac-2569]RZT26312.1 DNA-binding transcriptional MerR regulator [Kribbella sp. VKM Ac-2569]
MDHSIGAVARLAGVSVKAVRHYSDLGLLTARRTAAGHRRYDDNAVVQLRLIRTLRALDLDLPTIHAVLRDERPLAEVAATHADALAIQIRTLRRQHALLTVLANHPDPEDIRLMTEQSEQDRRALIAEFLDTTLAGTAPAVRQNLTPVLPEDADPQQVEAWLELTTLVTAPDFRDSVRRLVAGYLALAGDDPLRADPAYRSRLIELRRTEAGPHWHRYVELVAVVNGWAPPSRIAG